MMQPAKLVWSVTIWTITFETNWKLVTFHHSQKFRIDEYIAMKIKCHRETYTKPNANRTTMCVRVQHGFNFRLLKSHQKAFCVLGKTNGRAFHCDNAIWISTHTDSGFNLLANSLKGQMALLISNQVEIDYCKYRSTNPWFDANATEIPSQQRDDETEVSWNIL